MAGRTVVRRLRPIDTSLPTDGTAAIRARRHGTATPASRPSPGTAVKELVRGVRTVDVLLAVAAFAGMVLDAWTPTDGGRLSALGVTLTALSSVAVLALRRHPLPTLLVLIPLLLGCLAETRANRGVVGVVMVAVFVVGLDGARRRSLLVGAMMAPVVVAGVLITARNDHTGVDTVLYGALVLGALGAGDAVRSRRALTRVLAEEEERDREAAIRHEYDRQRLALAHELHDIVGHALVAINVRSSATAHQSRQKGVAPDPAVLDEIAAASAEALGELRATLKSMRSTDTGAAPLRPAARVDELADLVAGVQSAGLAVDLHVGRGLADLPDPVAHAGYRIVQEALTNVLRHSTATTATVQVAAAGPELEIEVSDRGTARHQPTPGGHGVPGMRERAAALGGSCRAGPRPDGGWAVTARLPVSDPR